MHYHLRSLFSLEESLSCASFSFNLVDQSLLYVSRDSISRVPFRFVTTSDNPHLVLGSVKQGKKRREELWMREAIWRRQMK